MDFTVRYLSHPQVLIDPDKSIDQWSLNELGQQRVAALAKSGVLDRTTRIVSSAEVKAVETARPLATALDLQIEVRPRMHENDRRATGFLPPMEFESVADAFFARPTESIRGWETAEHAQSRILQEVHVALEAAVTGDLLFVGHGAVGTLLYCALSGLAISRKHDQPAGGGCFFALSPVDLNPFCGWRPMEMMT